MSRRIHSHKDNNNISLSTKFSVKVLWLVSYLCIWLIPTIICIAVFFSYTNIISQTVNESYKKFLDNIIQSGDAVLSRAENIILQCSANTELINIPNESISKDRRQSSIYNVSSTIKNLDLISNMESYVYFYENDEIVSQYGAHDFNFFCQTYLGMNNDKITTLREKLKSADNKTYIPIEYNRYYRKQNAVLVSFPYRESGFKQNGVFLGMITQDTFESLCNENTFTSETQLICLDGNSNYVVSTTDREFAESLLSSNNFNSLPTSFMFTNNGNTYYGQLSGKSMWKYILIIPTNIISVKTNQAKYILLFGSIFSLLWGLILTFIILKTNYRPLKTITDLISSNENNQYDNIKSENEYETINKNIISLFEQNKKVREALDKYRVIAKHDIIRDILSGVEYDSADNRIKESGIIFKHEQYCIVVFCRSHSNDEENEHIGYINFAMKNVVEGLIASDDKYYISEMNDDIIAVIANFDNKIEDEYQYLKSISLSANDIINKEFGSCFFTIIGSVYTDIKDSYVKYNELRQIAGSMKYFCNDEVIFQDNLSKSNCSERMFIITQSEYKKLEKFISVGDSQSACEWIKNYLKKLKYQDSVVSLRVLQCTIYDLIGTITKISIEQEYICDKKLLSDYDFDILIKSDNLEHFQRNVNRIIESICEKIIEEKTITDKSDTLLNDVKQYINDNFSDGNMSAVSISEHFGMSGYYLSNIFKQKTGEKLVNYINHIRIEHSKEMLMDSSKTLEQIAYSCGFSSANTYIRTFKSYENITPRKYISMK